MELPAHTYAIFSALYAPHKGGVESFSQRLAHELARAGSRVLIATSRLDDSLPAHEIQDDGVEVFRLPAWFFLGERLPISRRNKEYKIALSKLAASGVDRVIVNARFYRNSLEGVRFAKQIDAPVIVLDHGSAHITLGHKAIDWLAERYEHAVTRRMKRLGPAFCGISQASSSWLEHFGIAPLSIIPNAVDVAAFRSASSQRSFKTEFGIREDQSLIAFVGRLEQEKGATQMSQTMKLLGNGYVCLMAGEGSLRSVLEEQSGDNVILLGNLSQEDLSALLGEADVFCLPSRSEGFCTSLLEAAAQDAIPVMPHVGGTDEVMGWNPTHYGVGLETIDPSEIADAIRVAAREASAGDGALSAYISRHCSWDNTINALEAAFERLEN